MVRPLAKNCIEVAWEVCNKVGGIYTVLKTKAEYMKQYYGDNYFLVGPYFPEKAITEFLPENPEEFLDIIEELEKMGIRVYYGRWDIPGKPRVFLIDFKNFWYRKNEFKGWLWEKYRIDSIRAGFDYDEPIVWGLACGILIEKLLEKLGGETVLHFHEWLSGGALLYLREKVENGIVFTTHATILGRTLAANGFDIISMIENGLRQNRTIDLKYAYDFWVEAKHLTEKACALNTDVFTTVSKLVARETKFILGKYPDIITPNGLNFREFPRSYEILEKYFESKRKLVKLIKSIFLPYYDIKISEEDVIIYISGRYEFRNKGIDLFIRALSILNNKLKEINFNRNIFTFLFIPSDVRGVNLEVLHNKILIDRIYEEIDKISEKLRDTLKVKIFFDKNIESTFKELLDRSNLRKLLRMFKKKGRRPPIITYFLNYDETQDPILKCLAENNLLNNPDDKVKVIFYPVYLSLNDKLLGMNYYDVIIGCDIGTFPSYYEPFGYTGLEAAAVGNISVVSDLSGFGLCIKEYFGNSDGIYVIRRRNMFFEDSARELAELLFNIVTISRDKLLELKLKARRKAEIFNWKNLVKRYIKAHNMSLQRKGSEELLKVL